MIGLRTIILVIIGLAASIEELASSDLMAKPRQSSATT
jgi:hypothetical protein